MNPIQNPYEPGAGNPPPELAGREQILADAKVRLGRVKAGRLAKSFMLVGLRGVGKTVLLNQIGYLAKQNDYQIAAIEAHEDKSLPSLLVPHLRQILLALDKSQKLKDTAVRMALGILKKFSMTMKVSDMEFGLGIEAAKGKADSGDIEFDLPETLLAVAEAAAVEKPVALIIDEMQYLSSKEFSALIMAVHLINQRQLPLLLIGAGLPQLVGLAGKSKSYAERLFDYPEIGPLSETDACRAIVEPAKKENVYFEDDALKEIIDVTQGYPFFLQVWGAKVWDRANSSPITLQDVKDSLETVTQYLDQNFFRVRFDRLTPKEREYLFAMADLGSGPHRSGDIAEKLEKAVTHVAPVRNSLIKKGMIYAPEHGDTAFTVPLFDQFLRRIQKKRKPN